MSFQCLEQESLILLREATFVPSTKPLYSSIADIGTVRGGGGGVGGSVGLIKANLKLCRKVEKSSLTRSDDALCWRDGSVADMSERAQRMEKELRETNERYDRRSAELQVCCLLSWFFQMCQWSWSHTVSTMFYIIHQCVLIMGFVGLVLRRVWLNYIQLSPDNSNTGYVEHPANSWTPKTITTTTTTTLFTCINKYIHNN